MECNKQEALRAKEIAEKKMQLKDFLGAKKVALKAQQLFSDLDNISQMITVCEVHCRAGLKVNGEMDWYGVLQLEQTADESSIKKQYRKLALLLHPDKNKFAGAEAAFKLIGEANMILSDRAKRSVYDMKRRANITTAVSKQPAQNANMATFLRKQPGVQHNFTSTATFHFGNINQQQSVGSQTFWTMCPACCMKFQYFRNLLNRSIRCNRCLQPFVATELNEQSVPRPWESSSLHTHTQNSKQEVPFQGSNFGNFSFPTGFQGNAAGGSSSGVTMDRGGKKEDSNKVKPEKVNTAKAGRKEQPVKPSAQNSRKKKGRQMVIESSDSESSTDLEYEAAEDSVHVEEQNIGTSNGRYPRRSSRVKQNVTYNERQIDDDDDDFVSPPKRLRKAGASSGIHNNANDDRRKSTSEENLPNGGEPVKKYKVHETEQVPNVTSEPVASSNVRSFSSPDSEFYDFEQERNHSKFAADQIWAVYDELDAMPRFYARIRQVFTPFRLRFTWLEYVPFREHESEWYSAELPVACGKYRHGKLESTTTVEMFSHQVSWKSGRGTNRNAYDIYPQKGEIWALFKGWDAGWISDANSHRLYEYEVVEVLSDLSDGNDFYVVDLVKVQGSVSLFMRSAVNGKCRILRSEVLRFSHRIPSYRLSGGEREGVPEGSFELDTASLPNNFGDVFPSVSPDTASVKAMNMKLNEENDMETTGSKGVSVDGLNGDSLNEDKSRDSLNEDNSVPADEYLEPEFHAFDEDKTIEKFQRGQIWAVYSDIDQYPKFYVMIKKVDGDDITVSWVELSPRGKDEEKWIEKTLPATCGRFKVERATNETFDTAHFSHMVQAEDRKKWEFDIYPRTGQVWALYKDWNMGWSEEDLSKCEYYVAEILEVTGSVVKVHLLTKVADYNCIFKPENKGGVEQVMEIPLSENLRFSHQIPAFQLTDEVDGSLRGYWELDSASAISCEMWPSQNSTRSPLCQSRNFLIPSAGCIFWLLCWYSFPILRTGIIFLTHGTVFCACVLLWICI